MGTYAVSPKTKQGKIILHNQLQSIQSVLEALKGKNDVDVPPWYWGFSFFYTTNSGKLDLALKCVFIGYSLTHKRYKCYHPPSRKFFVNMGVTFWEFEPYFSIRDGFLSSIVESENGERIQGEADNLIGEK